jgi:hypothetical protein
VSCMLSSARICITSGAASVQHPGQSRTCRGLSETPERSPSHHSMP